MANGRNGVDAETAHNARTFSKDAANVGTATLRERLAATTRLQRVAGSAAAIAALLVVGGVVRDEPSPKQTPIEQLKGVKVGCSQFVVGFCVPFFWLVLCGFLVLLLWGQVSDC